MRPAGGTDGGALPSAVRVVALVLLAGGALYAALLAVRPDDDRAAVAVRAPRVEDGRSVVAQPGPRPKPLVVERFAGTRDLDLKTSAFRFIRLVPQPPADVCAAFGTAGWDAGPWGPSPLGDLDECVASKVFGGRKQAEAFAVLRGRETLLEVRIKLNLYDGARRAEAAGEIASLVSGFFERWNWEGAAGLRQRIVALDPFEETAHGTRVVLSRERGEVERWNLSLRFPSPPKPPEDKPKASTLADIAAMAGVPVQTVPPERDTP
ncbi:hypothetical protein GGR05_002222 [Aureimonas phyllosphaerae]|uniref:Uncharacterized protein n=1 Tax=Aureimonas phyllosphaerae TaxID=1166078 RepID=A0A7W6C0D7_9HYPH|nr:hypothetical protein [Aureimonas phyllosphaerae]MBB3960203.1 hypothetical protein [Aureimonas phyllosphaerae]